MTTVLHMWLVAAALGFSWLPTQTGAIAGRVTDTEGGVLPGVTLTIRAEGRIRTGVTNERGEYRIEQLAPGSYRIETSLAGFATVVAEGVGIEANTVTAWNTTLKVALRGPADPFSDFQARIKQIVGPDATDCGQHRIVKVLGVATLEELQRFLACGLEAAGQKKPFWMSQQLQGIDSVVFSGVAGDATGTVYWLEYDSDPSGGSGAAPRFSAQPCAKPSIESPRKEWARLSCSR
jgi:hypothetical protein